MSDATEAIGGAAYLRLVGLGALIGVPAALVAALFLGLVHGLEHWLWTDLPSRLGHSAPPAYLVIGLPVAGAAIVLLARRVLPGDGGHPPLEGVGPGATPLRFAPGIALAALGTLSFGLVLGPEGPLIALGSAVGMTVTVFTRLGRREQNVVATAGSFSAISALFGGPIVAGMMLVESGVEMGATLLPILLPGFVAAAVGYVIFIGFGAWGGLSAQGLEPSLVAASVTVMPHVSITRWPRTRARRRLETAVAVRGHAADSPRDAFDEPEAWSLRSGPPSGRPIGGFGSLDSSDCTATASDPRLQTAT